MVDKEEANDGEQEQFEKVMYQDRIEIPLKNIEDRSDVDCVNSRVCNDPKFVQSLVNYSMNIHDSEYTSEDEMPISSKAQDHDPSIDLRDQQEEQAESENEEKNKESEHVQPSFDGEEVPETKQEDHESEPKMDIGQDCENL